MLCDIRNELIFKFNKTRVRNRVAHANTATHTYTHTVMESQEVQSKTSKLLNYFLIILPLMHIYEVIRYFIQCRQSFICFIQ